MIELTYDEILKKINDIKVTDLGVMYFAIRKSFASKITTMEDIEITSRIRGHLAIIINDTTFDKILGETTNYVALTDKEQFEKIKMLVAVYEFKNNYKEVE